MPLPESSFITAAQRLIQDSGPSSTLRQGDLAQKLEALKQAKAQEFEERTAILEARYEAMQKIAEGNAKKKKEQEEKKAQLAEARKKEAEEKREKRKYDQELTKQAREETRKFVAEVNKALAAKKKEEARVRKLAEKEEARVKKLAEKEEYASAKRSKKSHALLVEPGVSSGAAEPNSGGTGAAKKVNMFDEFR